MSFKLLRRLYSQSLQEFLIDRYTALLTFVFGILFFSLEVITGIIFFEHTDNIMGWTRNDYLLLVSTASFISFLYQTLFVASHENLTETIIEGELDHILLKPVNSFLFYALYRLDFPSLMNLIVALVAQMYFLQFYDFTVWQLLSFAAAILLATYLLFLLNQLAVSVSFWKEKARSILGLPEYVMDFASRPLVIYPSPIRFIFTWVVPLMIGVNLPVLIMKGQSYLGNLLFLLVVDVLGTILALYVWRKGVDRYVSAN